jgi:hypothetical protein
MEKILSKNNTGELIHKFCNKLIPENKIIRKGAYVFTPNAMYLRIRSYNYSTYKYEYNNSNLRLLAFIENDYIIINSFDNSSSWGGGYSSYSILRAAPNKDKVFIIHGLKGYKTFSLDEKVSGKDIIDFDSVIKRAIISLDNNTNVGYLAYIQNNVFDNKYSAWYSPVYSNDKLQKSVATIRKYYNTLKLETPFKDILNTILSEVLNFNLTYTKYSGWGRGYTETAKPKLKYGDLYRNTTFEKLLIKQCGKKYLKEFEFKVWRHVNLKYEDSFLYSLKESREIYEDEERRTKVTDDITARKEAAKREREAKERIKNRERRVDYVKKFIENDGVRVGPSWGYGSLNYDILAIAAGDVISSKGVKIPIVEAVDFYKKIVRVLKSPSIFNQTSILRLNIKVGGYTLSNITKEDLFDNLTDELIKSAICIRIGCHKIPLFEMERVIKHYNIDIT